MAAVVVCRASIISGECIRAATQLPSAQRRQYSSDGPRIIKSPTTASLKKGTGGRSSFNGIVCTVFGSTGFVGPYVCNRLGKIGTQLVIPHRCDPYDARHLKLVGDLGQVYFQPFQLRDEDSIRKCIKYSNVVINMIGREWETKNFKFHDVNAEGARTIARICKESKIERFIHVSCLNAKPNPTPIMLKGGSEYFKSKWAGECAVREEFPEATIVRPSDIYGQEDRAFLNYYTDYWRRHLRSVPMWKSGEATEKQPIWVGDVARGITEIVKDPKTAGQTYQFVGPRRYQLAEIVEWIGRLQRHTAEDWGFRRWDIKYAPLFKLKISLLQMLAVGAPVCQMHWEGFEKEHTTDVIAKGIPTLQDLGIQPCTMESRMAWEVRPFRADAYYMEKLGEFDPPHPPPTIPIA